MSQIKQTPEEIQSVQKAFEESQKPEPKEEERKLTALRKNKKLQEAAMAGDNAGVLLWLEAGADPNFVDAKAYTKNRILDYAVKSCNASTIEALLKVGAVLNAFALDTKDLQKNCFTPKSRQQMTHEKIQQEQDHLKIVFYHTAKNNSIDNTEDLMSIFKSASTGVFNHKDWREICLKDRNLEHLAHCLRKENHVLEASEWTTYVENFMFWPLTQQGAYSGQNQTLNGKTESQEYMAFIKEFIDQMPPQVIKLLFGVAADHEHAPLMSFLLKKGLKPDDQWMGRHQLNHYYASSQKETPIALLAYVSGAIQKATSQNYKILKHIEPAMQSARDFKMDPTKFRNLTVTQLLQMHEEGFHIDGKNEKGQNIAHMWAQADWGNPRAGWHSLIRQHPQLVFAKNAEGVTAFDALIKSIRDVKVQDEYRAMASNIESKQIAKEVKKVMPAKKIKKTEEPVKQSRRL